MHVTDRIKRARYGGMARGAPRKIFEFRPSEIAFGAVLGGKQQELDDQRPLLVIVFEAKLNACTI